MKFAEKTVEEFLFTPGKSFIIPEFQRPYSWQTSNVREFLEDLEETIEKNKRHYFGSVVFVLDNIDSNSIIDGQQRITTSLLMITAIYHLVKSKPHLSKKMTVEDINDKYLANRNDTKRIKLRTVTTDDMILQKIYDVDGDSDRLTQKERQSNVYLAYAEFRHYFNDKDNLDKYIIGLGSFDIITIALDARDDNPQRIFESINSTGKPLTDGDKIRNFALMLNDDRRRDYVYKQYWLAIEQALTDVNKDDITDFFKSYITRNRQISIRSDAVYPEFKKLFEKQVTTEQTIEELDAFYGDIVKNLQYYLFCKLGFDPNNQYDAIKNVVFKMRYIQTEIYIPFAMAALSYHAEGMLSDDELVKVFGLVETYFSRRIVCNVNTTGVDKFMASLHKDILEHLHETPDAGYYEVMKYLFLRRTGSTRMPSESEFNTAIRSNNTYNQRTAHVNYILCAIDDQSKESKNLHQIANGMLKLSIEHIMPQTLGNGWGEQLGLAEKGMEYVQQVHQQYIHTLANLTLTGYNSEYQNYSFENKKTMKNGFKESKLGMNTWIADQNVWNEATLLARQEWWIIELSKVWPMPKTSYHPVVLDTTVGLLDGLDLTGTGVRSVTVFGENVPVSTWAEVQDVVAEKLYDRYANFYDTVSNDDFASRFITKDGTGFSNSAEIYETGIFIDTGISTIRKLAIMKSLSELFDIPKSELSAELTAPLSIK